VHLLCNLPEEFLRADITMHSHPNDTTKSMQTYTFALDFALMFLRANICRHVLCLWKLDAI
jgi:hypothetical protein